MPPPSLLFASRTPEGRRGGGEERGGEELEMETKEREREGEVAHLLQSHTPSLELLVLFIFCH